MNQHSHSLSKSQFQLSLHHKLLLEMAKHLKQLIGRSDKADFPALDLYDIDVKIDTGAYSSSIHCHDIELKETEGREVLEFKLLDPGHDAYNHRQFRFDFFRSKNVRSSNGSVQERFFIKSEIRLFDRLYPIELSLAERGEMRYPVLIGRKLLKGKFLVDPNKTMLSFMQKVRN